MKIQNNIAATIKLAMAEKDSTLVDFAEEIGIARSSLQEYLKEGANPRADTIELIAEKLEMSPEELISGPASRIGRFSEVDEKASEISSLLQEIHRVFRYLGMLLSEMKTMTEALELKQNERIEK